ALTSWSPPVQLPGACGAALAVNAAGAEVAAGYQQNADGSFSVQVCTSTDGQNWSAPATLGHGVTPAVAIAPDGRAVVAWAGASNNVYTVQASVRPPGGQWSPAVTLTSDSGHPVVGMDGSGNAIAAWAASSGPIETASLPAGGAWTAVTRLATRGQALDLAVNATGSAIITWGTRTATVAAAGTVLGGFAAPVTLGFPPLYPVGHTRVVLNGLGDAAAAWTNGGPADFVATRAPNGTWSPAAKLSTTTDGPIDVAIDGAGNALTIFGQMDVSGSNVTATLYTSKHPAGGTWSTPAVLSVPGDAAVSPHVVADAAGTFAASWLDTTTGALNVLTSPPGSGFGAATTFSASAFGDLKIAPGHAVLSFRSVPINPMSISSEPVS
ncbi:MAG: hypothetical protein ACRDND_16395, partial [Streptosporangiaceae bacterium]